MPARRKVVDKYHIQETCLERWGLTILPAFPHRLGSRFLETALLLDWFTPTLPPARWLPSLGCSLCCPCASFVQMLMEVEDQEGGRVGCFGAWLPTEERTEGRAGYDAAAQAQAQEPPVATGINDRG